MTRLFAGAVSSILAGIDLDAILQSAMRCHCDGAIDGLAELPPGVFRSFVQSVCVYFLGRLCIWFCYRTDCSARALLWAGTPV